MYKRQVINRFDRGIWIQRSANLVTGCFVGTDAGGSLSLANRVGIVLSDFGTTIDSVTIGGVGPSFRNVISGNSDTGIAAFGLVDSIVEGNYVGTTRTGMAPLANGGAGLGFGFCVRVTIGGAPGAGNLISGNSSRGIDLGPSQEVLIQGNLIGTNATGSAALPNLVGIGTAQASANKIGGSAVGEGNVISGNLQDGILLANCTGYIVQGNLIGTDSTGLLGIPNLGHGVHVYTVSTGHLIGGQGPGERNAIAFNGGAGVVIGNVAGDASTGNRILGNSIHDNGGLGIDLGNDGVTANDPGDGDAGPNNLQNFPVLSAATSNGGSTGVRGSLNSSPATSFTIEFFASPVCDGSGNGEGQTSLGATAVTTDGSGNAAIDVTLPAPSVGQVVTATATDAAGNTSEFSA